MSASGVSVDPEKVEVVMSWERPKSVFEIKINGPYDEIDPEGGHV